MDKNNYSERILGVYGRLGKKAERRLGRILWQAKKHLDRRILKIPLCAQVLQLTIHQI